MDDDASQANKMSFAHPNSNLSDGMDYISQGEVMRKNPFLDFEFYQLRHLNPNSSFGQNL